ncbi:MFS transporter [Mesorhizobium sp. CA13]|uniref:MFS transporter n=1 Tax=unclassified Mesorhizobium TaxID=325217 RepID=UPI00112C1B8C|nr:MULTISPECIES: MFS transporter [unclassified Mesorhizobium]MBZ9856427.1 MFS transporter [Mesorhizobium sp. CA13]MBZ9965825.1 MFS transporter [Mesorhizobium sp. BR1-1-2]MCA0011943.1 MFS transporter [Mesorhizobium sp. B294B1A1]MCA0038197.1 MFS transporter [Mesorhizobium sp. B292B1B]TPM44073.1 MFS transporter [Mesorhizobium sp. B2-3-2]
MRTWSLARLWRQAERSRAILPIMALICLAGIGSSMLTTAVSLALSAPGIAPRNVQLVLTAYPLGFLVGCLIARPLVSRVGHERAFFIITVIAAIGTSGFVFTDLLPAWFCFRLLGGLAMAAMFVVCESWINLYADQHNRGRLFSVYMMTTAIAVLLGQVLLEIVGAHSPHLFGVSAATVLMAVLARFVSKPWPALPAPQYEPSVPDIPAKEERYGVIQLLRLAPVTVVSVFQAGVTNMNVFVLTPIYGAKIGLSASATVGLVTTVSIAGMLAQTPVGWLSDRFDRRVILLIQGLLSVSLCASIAWIGTRPLPFLFLLFFLYGATALTVYPVAIAFANSRTHSRHMVAASGTLLLLYSISNILTPGLSAALMEHTAPQAMLFVLGTGGILVAIAACINLRQRPVGIVVVQPSGGEP